MEPISLIVAALAAGAAAGVSNTASIAVQDAYTGLRELVQRRLAGRAAAQVAPAEHESAPDVWRAPLVAELETAGAGTDAAMIAAAQRVMAVVDEAGMRSGKYTVDLRGAQSVQVNVYAEAPSVRWPHRVGAVPLLADCFQERTPEMRGLNDAVSAGRTAVLTQVLSGLGGVGKTQLATALALAQATAYLRDRQETYAGYRRRLSDRRKRLAELFPEDALADDYRSTVAATWSISLETADRLIPQGLATPVLRLASVLDPNGAPLEVFTTPAALAFLTDQHQPAGPASTTDRVDEHDCRDALSNLHRLNLSCRGWLKVHIPPRASSSSGCTWSRRSVARSRAVWAFLPPIQCGQRAGFATGQPDPGGASAAGCDLGAEVGVVQ